MKLKLKTKTQMEPTEEATIEAKPKTKAKTPEAMVDAIGHANAEVEKLNAELMEDPRMVKLLSLQKESERLEKELREKVETPENIGQKVLVQGVDYACNISPSPEKRAITDSEKVVEHLESVQEGLALELANFTLGDLDKYLTPIQLAECITAERKGKRTLKIEAL